MIGSLWILGDDPSGPRPVSWHAEVTMPHQDAWRIPPGARMLILRAIPGSEMLHVVVEGRHRRVYPAWFREEQPNMTRLG